MNELYIIGVSKDQIVPASFTPENNVVLYANGVCIHQSGTNLPNVPALYFSLRDATGLSFVVGITETMFASIAENVDACKKAWINGDKPSDPHSPPGKNSPDPSLN